jgi:CRP/FNR family transcriptional regulator
MSSLPQPKRRPGPRSAGCAASDCQACGIRHLTFCAGLDDTEVGELAAISTRLWIEPQALLFQEGDPATNVFNVTSGAVRLYKLLSDGRRQITGFLLPGDFLGLAGEDGYSYSAEAIARTELCRFSRPKLDRVFERFPKLEHRLFQIATDELVAAQDQMLLLGRKTAAEKMASFLLRLSERERVRGTTGNPVQLPMTRGDIADYLGLTIETVSRVMSQFKKDGWVKQNSLTVIELADRTALEELTEG